MKIANRERIQAIDAMIANLGVPLPLYSDLLDTLLQVTEGDRPKDLRSQGYNDDDVENIMIVLTAAREV